MRSKSKYHFLFRLFIIAPAVILLGFIHAFIGLLSDQALGRVFKKTGENLLEDKANTVSSDEVKKPDNLVEKSLTFEFEKGSSEEMQMILHELIVKERLEGWVHYKTDEYQIHTPFNIHVKVHFQTAEYKRRRDKWLQY